MKNKKKAYTLTEILVVIVIVASLSAVVIPQYKNMVETRKTGEAEAVLTAVRTEQERRCAIGKEYVSIEKLTELVPEKSTKNFDYESGDESLIATSKTGSKYSYSLKVGTYRDGRICCYGKDCGKFNYPSCSDFEPVSAPECASDEAKGVIGVYHPKDPCEGVIIPAADSSQESEPCDEGFTGTKTRTKTVSYYCEEGYIKSTTSYGDWNKSKCEVIVTDPCAGVTVPDNSIETEEADCDAGSTGKKSHTKTTSYSCESGEIKSSISYGGWDTSKCVLIPSDPCAGVAVPDNSIETEEADCDAGSTGKKSRTKTTSYSCESGEIKSSISYGGWDTSKCEAIPTDPCEDVTVPDNSIETEEADCDAGSTGKKSRTKTTSYSCEAGEVKSSVSYSGWDTSKCEAIPTDPCEGVTVPEAAKETEKENCDAGFVGNKSRTKTTSYSCESGEIKSSVSYSGWDTSKCEAIPTDPCEGVSVPNNDVTEEKEACGTGYNGDKKRTKTTSYKCEGGKVVTDQVSYSGWDTSACVQTTCLGDQPAAFQTNCGCGTMTMVYSCQKTGTTYTWVPSPSGGCVISSPNQCQTGARQVMGYCETGGKPGALVKTCESCKWSSQSCTTDCKSGESISRSCTSSCKSGKQTLTCSSGSWKAGTCVTSGSATYRWYKVSNVMSIPALRKTQGTLTVAECRAGYLNAQHGGNTITTIAGYSTSCVKDGTVCTNQGAFCTNVSIGTKTQNGEEWWSCDYEQHTCGWKS